MEGRKDAQVSLLLWKAALRFATEDDEGTGGVIVANRSIFEGRGSGTLKKGREIDPLEGRYGSGR